MRVVLTVESGRKQGHKIWLRGRQSLSVGATEWADLALPDDPQLSHVHFTLHSQDHLCRVLDQESETGTFVNGQPIFNHRLADGDRLMAGRTSFLVSIESRPTQ